jgi:transposase
MVDVAMDLHKRHSQVGTLDEWGEIQQLRIEHDGDSREMEKFLGELEAGSRIAIEATGSWWWVVDLAEKHGHEVVLSNPKKTRLIADACLKNDRVDTDQLLHLLRLGYLPRVWIPPAPLRYGKEVLRYRALLVRMRTGLKNHLGALLTKRNLKGPGRRLWSKPGEAYLEKLELNAEAADIRNQTLALRKTLDALMGRWDQELGRRVRGDQRVWQLQTVPGVGAQTAFAYRVFVGDVNRFASGKQIAKYFGLVPRERSSGEQRHLGHITKEGDGLMRTLLVEAALRATRQAGPLREYYRRMVRHKGKAKARVAVARKLAVILYQMWKKDLTYGEFPQREAQLAGGLGNGVGH